MRSSSRSGLGGGFVLTELLVVISIIGILIGILGPLLQRVRIAAAELRGYDAHFGLGTSLGNAANALETDTLAAQELLEQVAYYEGNPDALHASLGQACRHEATLVALLSEIKGRLRVESDSKVVGILGRATRSLAAAQKRTKRIRLKLAGLLDQDMLCNPLPSASPTPRPTPTPPPILS